MVFHHFVGFNDINRSHTSVCGMSGGTLRSVQMTTTLDCEALTLIYRSRFQLMRAVCVLSVVQLRLFMLLRVIPDTKKKK